MGRACDVGRLPVMSHGGIGRSEGASGVAKCARVQARARSGQLVAAGGTCSRCSWGLTGLVGAHVCSFEARFC